MTLKKQIAEFVKFDDISLMKEIEENKYLEDMNNFEIAEQYANWQYDKLKPLLSLLPEIVEALGAAHVNACSCCDSNVEVKKHCDQTLAKIKEAVGEK